METNKPLKPVKQRIWELDFIRGICVLLMIFDHTMFDISDIFGKAWYQATQSDFFYNLWQNARYYFYYYNVRQIVEPLVVFIFCFICGISCSFSKSNFKRGLQIGVCSILITIVTTLIDEPITFGIFHMFTVAILFWCVINLVCKNNKFKTMMTCGMIGVAIITINYVLTSIYNCNSDTTFTSSNSWYFVGEFMVTDYSSVGSDYQPIFPLVGYMLVGAGIGPILYKNKKTLFPILGKYDWYKPFNFWGKIAMWVYIFHQVLIAGILALISFLFITPGNWIII